MWVAAYEISSPPLPADWMTYSYWQYTSVGTVPGVATPGGTGSSSVTFGWQIAGTCAKYLPFGVCPGR